MDFGNRDKRYCVRYVHFLNERLLGNYFSQIGNGNHAW